jgi:hypothetical protein
MRVQDVHLKNFKRFSDLTISDLPAQTRLVVMAGPNGTGKSSVFDGFRIWQSNRWKLGIDWDKDYFIKQGSAEVDRNKYVDVTFHGTPREDAEVYLKAFYIRSAYRNEPDFTTSQLQRTGTIFEDPILRRLIDNDVSVGRNYQRLVSQSVEGIYSGRYDNNTVKELRENFIGTVRASMANIFGELVLSGPGDPLQQGSFFFEKGESKNFHYKNLSGGEKAAFDIILDVIVKRVAYDDTVYCLDEPEAHMHTRLQALFLKELLSLIPQNSQLWIATHSIGMMRAARDIYQQRQNEVVFLNFSETNFDQPVILKPSTVNREFWVNTLAVALDDLANLVAPREVILCEGKPLRGTGDWKAERDAQCYRKIFGREFPDTDFLSVGNAEDVKNDRLEIGRAIQTLTSGTKVTRLIDRDERTEEEIEQLEKSGVRVLARRHLEAYLMDNEILARLCEKFGQPEKRDELLKAKADAISASSKRGNAANDIKSPAGEIFTRARDILGLADKSCGSNTDAFLRDTLAPLITEDTKVYTELKNEIFG